MSQDIRAVRENGAGRHLDLGKRDDSAFPRAGLSVLAAAIFISMSSEFLPGGFLADISDTFDRSVTEAGQLISVFAAAVIVFTAPLAMLTRRVPRKSLAVIALIGITIATFGTAAAPTFEMLLAARVLGGAAHGLFWSVAAAYAADLVRPSQLGRATAITAAGGSLAGVLGVPLGNALGQIFGWRIAFAAIACLALVVIPLLIALLPSTDRSVLQPTEASTTSSGGQRSTMPSVLLICAVILAVVIGQTTFGTYAVVWLTDVASLPSSAVPVYLLVTGLGSLLAISMIGRIADRHPNGALTIGAILVVVLISLFPLINAWGLPPLIALAVVQSMAFAVVPALLQIRMMRVVAPHQRSTAAALQTTTFNIAIGGGAVLGAHVVGSWSLEALPWAAGVLSGVGLVILILNPLKKTTEVSHGE